MILSSCELVKTFFDPIVGHFELQLGCLMESENVFYECFYMRHPQHGKRVKNECLMVNFDTSSSLGIKNVGFIKCSAFVMALLTIQLKLSGQLTTILRYMN